MQILPQRLSAALGIAIYGMFIAIIVPPARKYFGALLAVLISVVLSCIFKFVPFFSWLSDGFSIIICAVVSAGICAKVAPIFKDVPEEEQQGEDKA